jgi:Flp pilus assembly protein TadG
MPTQPIAARTRNTTDHVRAQRALARQRGAVAIYVALCMLVLIALAGLAIDSAVLATTGQQLQQAADAGALAGVRLLAMEKAPHTVSRQQVIEIALANAAANEAVQLDANLANEPAGDIVTGIWDADANTFTPDTWAPNAIRVRARRTEGSVNGPVDNVFGSIFGADTSETAARATATFGGPGGGVPLILALDPHRDEALRIAGDVELDVSAGTIHANSDGACGLSAAGNVSITVAQASVVGEACYASGQITGPVVEGTSIYPDPLADVLPTVADWDAYRAGMSVQAGSDGSGMIEASGTYSPGHYPQGLVINATMNVVLLPGVYMFGGYGVLVDGQARLEGSGVTLLIDEGSRFHVAGTSSVAQLSPPEKGLFAGVTIFSHRNNNHTGLEPKPHGNPHAVWEPWDVYIAGTSDTTILGAIYCPSGHTILAGTPGKEIGAIITNSVANEGTTGFTLSGEGVNPINLHPAGYLVE